MSTTVNGYPNDKTDGNPLSAAEVNTLSDGSELHHVNFSELFGTGVIGATDWNLGIVAGQIALTITAGQGIVGDAGERKVCETTATITIDADQGLAAGSPTTYYVFKKRDLTDTADPATGFVAQTSSTPPADSILIGTASMGATEAASVDNLPQGRINLRNPIVLSGLAADKPTFGVAGRFYFETDTSGGTLWFDTGAAWQQVGASTGTYLPITGGTLTGALGITGSADAVQLSITANATQTANLVEWKHNSGRVALSFIASTLTLLPDTTGASQVLLSSYANVSAFNARRFNGDTTTPTAVSSTNPLLRLNAAGYHSGGAISGTVAQLEFQAAEAFTNSAQGTRAILKTTPTGSTTAAEAIRFDPAGGVNIGGASDNQSVAILEVESTTRGAICMPLMTTAQAEAITAVQGLQVYDSTVGAPRAYGVRWSHSVRTLYTATADVTVGNTGTATSVVSGTALGSPTLNFNYMGAVGKTLRITGKGHISETGTPTLRVKLFFGATNVLDSGAFTLPASLSISEFEFVFYVTTRSTGAGGTVQAQGYIWTGGTRTPIVNTATSSVNTTSNHTLDVTVQWGTANASNTLTVTNLYMEALP